ncbi:M14 family metallopeptidase [Negadavirga shengliensis]|uniref:M14 metallopeptidase family protein n=1 Tax=Negadavirga shengliensis TaxID=1389218 RepID=A0ABV9SV35_9BACT
MSRLSVFVKKGWLSGIIFVLLACQERPHHDPLDIHVLAEAYETYKEEGFSQRRFGHDILQPLIEKRAADFTVEELGRSVLNAPIHSLETGEGKTKVMLWSQMHGNESTATMALFDLFNFFEGPDEDGFEDIRATVLENLRIKFIPMVNPDGAETFQRRNALDIDLNRDAVSLVSPEAQILKAARDTFDPAFGFNLHDQNIYYNTKGSPNPATISVLAPAYNEATEINEVRLNAMKVIAGMDRLLQQEIPGHVGKYDDAFEPRAFGDNFQKWGTSTILIESGGYPGDPEKQYIRKLNFMAILNALYEIATEGHQKYTEQAYFSIPDNDSKMMDMIIRNAKVNKNGYTYTADIGIRRRETNHGDRDYRISGVIEDLGDLSVFYGYEEITGDDLEIVMGKSYGETLNWDEISDGKSLELLQQGHLAIKIKGAAKGKIHGYPIRVFTEDKALPSEIGLGGPADFFLSEKGKLRYAIVNGYLVDLQNPSDKIYKHLIE